MHQKMVCGVIKSNKDHPHATVFYYCYYFEHEFIEMEHVYSVDGGPIS